MTTSPIKCVKTNQNPFYYKILHSIHNILSQSSYLIADLCILFLFPAKKQNIERDILKNTNICFLQNTAETRLHHVQIVFRILKNNKSHDDKH